jgi:hypothetical protein
MVNLKPTRETVTTKPKTITPTVEKSKEAVREKKKQEQDPLFIATQLYGEAQEAAGKLRRPKQSREERSALRLQLYKAVQEQEEQKIRQEEEEAGEAMRQALVLKAQIGRPSCWHPDLGRSLCAWVADGRPMRAWCRQTGISMENVFEWMDREPRFAERYRMAREQHGVESLVDDLLRLPDEAAGTQITMPQAKVLELQVSVRQWLASKLLPKKYGETRRDDTAQGVINISIGIPPKDPITVVEG